MAPIRKGDGTGLGAKGFSQVRKGDGTILWNATPDTTERQPDNNTFSNTSGEFGPVFTTNDGFDYDEIFFRISGNTTGQETAYLRNDDTDEEITTKDVSGLSAGDSFSISANYEANTQYVIYLTVSSGDFDAGYYDSPSYPITGQDIDIIEDWNGGSRSSSIAASIDAIGGVGLD